MVKDRTRGEVDQAYLDWVHDQPLPKVMLDLKNAKEELAQRDAIFEVRVRKHRSTILTLQEDLGISRGAMKQQDEEYKKEKAQLICAQSRLQTQVKASMERERERARRLMLIRQTVRLREVKG